MAERQQTLKTVLVHNVKGILPHFSDNNANDLADFLISKGVKKELDLRRISVSVLEQYLHDLIDASDLYDEWQKRFAAPGPSQATPSTSNSSRASLETQETAQGQPTNSILTPAGTPLATLNAQGSSRRAMVPRPEDAMPHFDKDSVLMPGALVTAIENKKRAPSSARVQLAERIVDHCRKTVPNLQRSMFNIVALRLVTLYPETFKDTVMQSEHGSDSLAKQFRDRFDNDKRPSAIFAAEKEAPCIKEAYGCAKWAPQLPDGESEDSQEEKRLTLKTIHGLSPKDWEWKLIKANMEQSFYLQRKDINGALAENNERSKKRKRTDQEDAEALPKVSIETIRERWPFLFTGRGMNYHFHILTRIDFRDSLFNFIQEEGNVYIEFLATKGPLLTKVKLDMVKAERNGHLPTTTKLPTLLLMLVRALKDDVSYLVRYIESTTSFEEVTATVDFPPEGTPLIVAAGSNLYECRKYFLCVDNCPVTTVGTISEAFSLLFCAYFALNIEFATPLSGLLNFSQRVIANMPAQKGGKSKTAAIDKLSRDRVVKLHNKYVEFKQQLESLEQ